MRSTIIPGYHALKINAASYVHKIIMQMVGIHTTSIVRSMMVISAAAAPDERPS
jgi:hypothetical protein